MTLLKQSVGSAKKLRSSGDSTKDIVEGPALSTRSKKLRSSGNIHEAPKRDCWVSDSVSSRQSRKGGSNCDGGSGDSSRFRQPLSGIQNLASRTSFMTRARKSRTEQRLATALNWNSGEKSYLQVPSQESRLGSDWRNKENTAVGGISGAQRDSILPCSEAHLSWSESSQASFCPSGIPRSDDDDFAVPSEECVQIPSLDASDVFRASSEASPSPDESDASALPTGTEKEVQNSPPRSCQKLSSEVPTSSEDDIVSVTPVTRASSRLASAALQTPEQLVSALGEGVSPRNCQADTEGNLRVYERRTSQQLGEKSRRAETCPQFRGASTKAATSTRGKGTGSQHYSLRSLRDFFTPQIKVGSVRKNTPCSSSQSNSMLLPESYRQEKCAYFAEVDAFELLEEEADEEEDLEEPDKQNDPAE